MEQQSREKLYWLETVFSSPGPAKSKFEGDSNNSQQERRVERGQRQSLIDPTVAELVTVDSDKWTQCEKA